MATEYKHYGMAKDNDLTFLLRKHLEKVDVGEYQAQLHFQGSICISIEGECKLDKKTIAYAELKQLVGNSVSGVTSQDEGTTNLFFADGKRLSILDSNSPNYESYQITAPGVAIVV
ncbi:MAG: hypothetical protein ACKV2U_20745 [Bryobacteraceae bacterium]